MARIRSMLLYMEHGLYVALWLVSLSQICSLHGEPVHGEGLTIGVVLLAFLGMMCILDSYDLANCGYMQWYNLQTVNWCDVVAGDLSLQQL